MNMRAIIFDMDGVLIDTEKYLTKYWCQAAKEFGYDMTLDMAYSIRSLSGAYGAEKLQSYFGLQFDYEAVRSRRKELMNEHLRECGIEIKPTVLESLKKLKESGYILCVATSTDSERANKYLSEIGIKELFDHIVCANMVKRGKPQPDIYLYVSEQINVPVDECFAVEDSPNGVLSAYRAGMKVIMIPDLTEPTSEDKSRLWAVAKDMRELSKLVAR